MSSPYKIVTENVALAEITENGPLVKTKINKLMHEKAEVIGCEFKEVRLHKTL